MFQISEQWQCWEQVRICESDKWEKQITNELTMFPRFSTSGIIINNAIFHSKLSWFLMIKYIFMACIWFIYTKWKKELNIWNWYEQINLALNKFQCKNNCFFPKILYTGNQSIGDILWKMFLNSVGNIFCL